MVFCEFMLGVRSSRPNESVVGFAAVIRINASAQVRRTSYSHREGSQTAVKEKLQDQQLEHVLHDCKEMSID